MAVTTANMDIGGAWTQLTTGDLDAMVQLLSVGTIEVYVGQATPAADIAPKGVFLSNRSETVFSITGMGATDNVYARVPAGTTENITLMRAPQPV